ncbi:MAG: 3-phosphoglycerate dehydrogenase [Bacteroidetes bacterium GWF2_38_335]|nr:MAG: 3-phosphoglycerate dehydrogenase [Bacteroidetes bacterium GWF2_38_335]OFY78208.1 MAG: 3-phosphoglycerate dehydrogenase [Bacteroidetes bacterium RIFOXYA12_FULL_38_20]HBS88629.1 3-phosphoglycerate dehydrogenase [Bacteroidales bacterium]
MIKILANDGLSNSGCDLLKGAGFHLDNICIPQDNLIAEINKQKYDVLLVRSATYVTRELIDSCPSLKIIGRVGSSMENIAVAYAIEKGIKVISTPKDTAPSVAELVFAHIFSLSRNLFDSNRKMPKSDNFKQLKDSYCDGIEIVGKTIGIIGFGRIGQEVAKRALGLGMNVLASDPYVTEANIHMDIQGTKGITVTVLTVPRDQVIRESNYITLHLPIPDDHDPVLTKKEFDMMKEGVIIINASKGALIDEGDLIDALDSGKVNRAGIDVFCNEPNPRKDLVTHEKVSVTPHVGAATHEAQERISITLADEIIKFFK